MMTLGSILAVSVFAMAGAISPIAAIPNDVPKVKSFTIFVFIVSFHHNCGYTD